MTLLRSASKEEKDEAARLRTDPVDGESIVTLLHEQLRLTPAAVAVRDGRDQWTYRELHAAADRVAERLRQEGIGPGDRVGIFMPRTKETVAAVIGVLVAGAAYVPLDPDYPATRLSLMCERAAMSVVLGPPELTDRLDLTPPVEAPLVVTTPVVAAAEVGTEIATAATATTVVATTETATTVVATTVVGTAVVGTAVVDTAFIGEPGDAASTERPDSPLVDGPQRPVGPDPASAAYVLFTSGSTGVPKGVQVSHRNLAQLMRWTQKAFVPGELDVTALDAPLSFDLSIFEIFAPLTNGGMIRMLANALSMGELDPDDPVTLAFATPSALGELVRLGRVPPSLRTLLVGGEVFPSGLARQVLEQTSVTRLLAVYGPTETTVLTTTFEVTLPVEDPLPIGRDLPDVDHLILDEHLAPVPDGEVGEMFITGGQVSDGYIHDSIRTAERFIDWRGPDQAKRRVYRSGDLGRRRPDGILEFHGRVDKQIKLRGYRIEPGEIETVMSRHPGVAQAFVRAEGTGAAAKLIGYIVTDGRRVVVGDLLDGLRASLTPYMVPSGIVVLPRFPLTPAGKLDQSALPVWTPSLPDDEHPPLSEAEQTVAELIGDVLGVRLTLGPDDDFIDDLGGTSLGVVQLLARMEETFGCHLRVDRVAANTTVAGFADLVRELDNEDSTRMIVHPDGSKPPLFLFHAYLGALLRYRRLGSHLSPERPIVAIQVHDLNSDRESPTTIEEMAERSIAEILKMQPSGPYLLGGHSAGGLIAFEVARRMAEMGESVAELIIIDSPVSSPRWRYYWSEAALNWPEVRNASAADRIERVRRLVRSRLSLHRQAPVEDKVTVAVERTNRLSNLACLHYATPHYPGDLVLLRTAQGMRMAAGNRLLGWGRHVGGTVTVLDLAGGHNTMFEPEFLPTLAGRLNEVLGDVPPGE